MAYQVYSQRSIGEFMEKRFPGLNAQSNMTGHTGMVVLRISVEHNHPKLSVIVYLGVRVGGVWWLPYKTARWGYGYAWPARGPQDADYVTPPITPEALSVRIRDEITGLNVD